jgi:hypothetical protein
MSGLSLKSFKSNFSLRSARSAKSVAFAIITIKFDNNNHGIYQPNDSVNGKLKFL